MSPAKSTCGPSERMTWTSSPSVLFGTFAAAEDDVNEVKTWRRVLSRSNGWVARAASCSETMGQSWPGTAMLRKEPKLTAPLEAPATMDLAHSPCRNPSATLSLPSCLSFSQLGPTNTLFLSVSYPNQ